MQRTIVFDGIPNCRDLGGLRNTAGQTIRRGRLLRAAHLHMASRRDLRRLAGEYRLTLLVDLRTPYERAQKPDRLPQGVTALTLPIFDEVTAGITREDGTPAPLIVPDMRALYRIMVRRDNCRAALGQALRAIMSQEEGAVLWHCTAGKDRCGLVSALLLTALGADRETIMDDYLLTNKTAAPEAERYYRELLSDGIEEHRAAAVRDVFLAREDYLLGAFEEIDTAFGGGDAFLRRGLGLPETALARFRERMLE